MKIPPFIAHPPGRQDPDTKRQFDELMATVQAVADDYTFWAGQWNGGCYEKGAIVESNGYLMVSNKYTCDPPEPQDVGDPYFVYTGAEPTQALTAKTLLVGNVYTAPHALKVPAARVYTIAGNLYSVYLRNLDTGQISELLTFVAYATGWVEIAGPGNIIAAGTQFEVALYATEPDPTPVTFVGNWNYITPNNAGTPASGQISHADKAKDSLRIHKTDADGGDRSTELAGMAVGDTIEAGNIRWSISAIQDNGTWIDFSVAPQSQISDGVQQFTFETVTASPITVIADPDFYLGNAEVRPFYSIDGGARVLTDDAYSVDIQIQEISISDDWDFMSQTGGSGGGGGGGTPVEIVEANAPAGWQVWGDILIQWGVEPGGTNGERTVTFTQPFKTTPTVSTSPNNTGTEVPRMTSTNAITTTGFTTRVRAFDGSYQSDPVGWVAVGEAPDDLKKAKVVTGAGGDNPAAPFFSEFHDPAGVASWRIIGTTLECWGVVGGQANPTVNFPKVFVRPPAITTTSQGGNSSTVVANVNSLTTTDCSFRQRAVAAASWNNSSNTFYWHAIGVWDGVS